MGVSLNGGTSNLHPKMIIFSRKTHGCWVPPFKEIPISNNQMSAKPPPAKRPEKSAVSATPGTDAGVSPATPSVSSGKTVGFWNQREGKHNWMVDYIYLYIG